MGSSCSSTRNNPSCTIEVAVNWFVCPNKHHCTCSCWQKHLSTTPRWRRGVVVTRWSQST